MAKSIPGRRGFKFVQMKYHAPSKRRWLRIEIAKINWQNLKIFLLRTPRSIATKLVTKFPWVVGIQVYSIKWTRPFPRGDNFEIAKILWRNKKKFSRTTEPISTKLCTSILSCRGLMVLQIRTIHSSKMRWLFFPFQINVKLKANKPVSQVSDVAHRPLVLWGIVHVREFRGSPIPTK